MPSWPLPFPGHASRDWTGADVALATRAVAAGAVAGHLLGGAAPDAWLAILPALLPGGALRSVRQLAGAWRPGGAARLPGRLLDTLPGAVLVVDRRDSVVAASPGAHAMLGYAPGALVGTDLTETLLAPRQRDAYRSRLRAPVAPEQIGRAEPTALLTLRRADGTEMAAVLSVREVPDSAPPLFAVTLRDPREGEGAAAELAAARAAAEVRQRMLHTIVDAIPDPVVALDRTGAVLFRNRASQQRAASAAGAAEDAAPSPQTTAVLQSGVALLGVEEPDPAGGTRRLDRVPVHDAAGTVVGMVVLSRDITEQKASEARLLREKQAAEAAAHANTEFLATTSHEIRTLMNGVTGMTNLLLDTSLDEEQRDFVDTIRTSSDALLTIINDILDHAKLEAGMLAVEARPFAVRQTVHESVHMLSAQAAAQGLALAAHVADAVPETVVGDATRLQQVLMNLLTNALKFTAAGSVQVHVGWQPAAAGGRPALRVAVQDTGIGIAPERLAAVFERYEQAETSTARRFGGTGLGLSICRQLVELMGGQLEATSVVGEGSVFAFTVAVDEAADAAPVFLPFPEAIADVRAEPAVPFQASVPEPSPAEPTAEPTANEPAAELPPDDTAVWVARPAPEPPPVAPEPLPLETIVPAAAVRPPVREAAAPPPAPPAPARTTGQPALLPADSILPRARVLLVEDNPVNQKVTVLTLRRLGYLPDVASNGVEAVDAVRREPYDVVLMDVMMPVMDGLEATRRIRANPGRAPAPTIVALTANAMQGDRQMCLDAGCDDYLAKPVPPRILAATIEQAIRTRDAALA